MVYFADFYVNASADVLYFANFCVNASADVLYSTDFYVNASAGVFYFTGCTNSVHSFLSMCVTEGQLRNPLMLDILILHGALISARLQLRRHFAERVRLGWRGSEELALERRPHVPPRTLTIWAVAWCELPENRLTTDVRNGWPVA